MNVETCNKTGEACAIVTGVKDHEAMATAKVRTASKEAEKLGVTVGMTGREALDRFREEGNRCSS